MFYDCRLKIIVVDVSVCWYSFYTNELSRTYKYKTFKEIEKKKKFFTIN